MAKFTPWILLSILYSPVLFQLYRSRWENIDYTHAYFILPASLLLAWLKRKQLQGLSSGAGAPCPPQYLALLILGLAMYIFGWRKDYLFISALSLIPALFGLTAYLYGPQIASTLRFPIFYLLLLVPPPLGILDAITLPMRYNDLPDTQLRVSAKQFKATTVYLTKNNTNLVLTYWLCINKKLVGWT